MYVCGPTVYDRPHIGNARAAVVFDVLYRLLAAEYGMEQVTYARNITDVDDKINTAAKENGESILSLTTRTTEFFHADMDALNVLKPTIEPRATAHIAEMIAMIAALIAKGHAYEAKRHVLFRVGSYGGYGKLSGRSLDEMIAGARVEVAPYKENPADFVLWKPADEQDDVSSVFDSPWGRGRPGWHIECSAMSTKYLGADFDIHGGGRDLIFPHHENEVAQACAANPGSHFAGTWVHNGFLTVNGEKMSKSLGNFITVHDLLEKGVKGEVIRLALLSTHYRKPLDWSDKLLEDSKKTLDGFYRALLSAAGQEDKSNLAALADDLNTPEAFAHLHALAGKANSGDEAARHALYTSGRLLGFFNETPEQWFGTAGGDSAIDAQIQARIEAKKAKNWAEADRIRATLLADGIVLEDKPDGTTIWRKV